MSSSSNHNHRASSHNINDDAGVDSNEIPSPHGDDEESPSKQSHATTTTIDPALLHRMIERLDTLQTEVNALKKRNFEKDRGKEFESSYTRILFLMAVTYFTLLTYMALVIKSKNPYLDAIVPTVGFNISTWSLPYVKEWWIQARHFYIHAETESTTLRRLEEESSLPDVAITHNDDVYHDVEEGGRRQSNSTQQHKDHHTGHVRIAPAPTAETDLESVGRTKP